MDGRPRKWGGARLFEQKIPSSFREGCQEKMNSSNLSAHDRDTEANRPGNFYLKLKRSLETLLPNEDKTKKDNNNNKILKNSLQRKDTLCKKTLMERQTGLKSDDY